MPKTQMDYSHTVIYKLCCKDTSIIDIYIGHTTNFNQRKHNHKTSCCNENTKNHNLHVYKFIRNNGGWDNWTMIQIEEFNCNNSREATIRERYWIELLKSTLNMINPFTSLEEKVFQKQGWYEENKEEILQKAKENYQENKEHKLEYQKQYSEEHKEEISEKQKEYREKNKEKLAEQKKEYRAAHKEEASKAHKQWRETNKEKLKEQRSQIINCECGSQYTFGNKNRHLQSKLHIAYQNKLCGIITEVEPKISEEEQLLIQKQKQKEYREKNSDKIKEYKKKYNDENKEHNKEQNHKYYEEHKEVIKLKTKEYVEENKEKVKEYQDNWYQKNKEKILEKQKQVFLCECGSEVRCSGKAEHLRSTKHKNYIEGLQITPI
jgi:hypothetical protein